jgi:hypothetical protein
MGVAAPAGDDKISVSVLRSPHELPDKGCLAAPRFAGGEDHVALSEQCEVKIPIQCRQLATAGHESRSFSCSRLSLREEGWLLPHVVSGQRKRRTLSIQGSVPNLPVQRAGRFGRLGT